MFRTVHRKVIGLIIVFLLLVVSSFVASYLTVQTHFIDEETIELVHNDIPIVQAITWMAFTDENPEEIEAAVNQYDQDLKDVQAAISRIDANFPFQTTDGIQLHVDNLEEAWTRYQLSLDSLMQLSIQDPQRAQAEEKIKAETLNMFAQIEELTQAVEYYSRSRHNLLLRLQIVFLISISLSIFLGYLLIRQRVVKPLVILNQATKRIENGVLEEPIVISGGDEISQLAQSFDNMRIAVLAHQMDLEKRIDERTLEITTAFEFSQEIVSQQDTHHIVQSVINKTCTLMQALDASLCLVTPDGRSVELVSAANNRPADKNLIQPIRDNLPDLILTRTKPVASQISKYGCAFLQHMPENQCLSAPLRVGEQVFGAMCVVRSKDEPFTKEESRAFSLLANSTAIAIMNARYAEDAQQQAHLAAVKSERERLASELHDNLAQTLNLVNLNVSQLQKGATGTPNDVDTTIIASVKTNVESAIEQVRMIVSEITSQNQALLNGEELLHQLDLDIQGFQKATGILVNVTGTDECMQRISALARKQCLMIINEALTNARRHAEAKNVAINFSSDRDHFCVTIEDDGKGFNPDVDRGNLHLGLRIMRTRAERSGGNIRIESAIGKGTRITACFPIKDKEIA